MKTSTRLAVGAAALLLLAACCRALTVEEAVQTINKASWDFYGSSLPDCNGELITVGNCCCTDPGAQLHLTLAL